MQAFKKAHTAGGVQVGGELVNIPKGADRREANATTFVQQFVFRYKALTIDRAKHCTERDQLKFQAYGC